MVLISIIIVLIIIVRKANDHSLRLGHSLHYRITCTILVRYIVDSRIHLKSHKHYSRISVTTN